MGCASVGWRRTNATPRASPARRTSTGSQPMPSWAICLRPRMTRSTAAIERTALAISGRPALGFRYSGRSRGPTTRRSTITGTATRNTEPHQKCSSSTPPISGPIAPPSEKLVAQTPIATVRWRASMNMLRISESVDGASVAPAIPRSARLRISISGARGEGGDVEAMPNAAAPISSRRRRPIRSPSVPIVISEPASRKP